MRFRALHDYTAALPLCESCEDQTLLGRSTVEAIRQGVMNGIAFGQSSQARYIKTKRAFDICYTIEENTHKRGEVQLQIDDIRPSEATAEANK